MRRWSRLVRVGSASLVVTLGVVAAALAPVSAHAATTGRATSQLVRTVGQVRETAATGSLRAQVAPARGLRVVVIPPPTKNRVRVTVRGPHRFRRTISKTTVFRRARPGVYRIRAGRVRTSLGTAYPKVTPARVRVRSRRGAQSRVAYPVVVSTRTDVIRPAVIDSITGPTSGRRTVVLTGPIQHQVGDFLVSGTLSQAPQGLLTKVTAVDPSGPGTTYTVVPALLPEVLPRLQFAKTVRARITGLPAGGATGQRLATRSASACTLGEVKRTLNGTIALTVRASVDRRQPRRSYLRATASADAEASLAVAAQATCSTGEQQLGRVVHLPNVEFTIGPVPVVLVPTLRFTGEAAAATSAAVSAKVGATLHAEAWLQSTTAGAVTVGKTAPKPAFTHTLSLNPQVSATVSGTLAARLTTDLYGIAGPYAKLSVRPVATSSPTADFALSADLGLGVDVGLVLDKCNKMWGAHLCAKFDVSQRVIDKTWNVYRSHPKPAIALSTSEQSGRAVQDSVSYSYDTKRPVLVHASAAAQTAWDSNVTRVLTEEVNQLTAWYNQYCGADHVPDVLCDDSSTFDTFWRGAITGSYVSTVQLSNYHAAPGNVSQNDADSITMAARGGTSIPISAVMDLNIALPMVRRQIATDGLTVGGQLPYETTDREYPDQTSLPLARAALKDYTIDPHGVTFWFDKFEASVPGAADQTSVTVPWFTLRPVLRAEGQKMRLAAR